MLGVITATVPLSPPFVTEDVKLSTDDDLSTKHDNSFYEPPRATEESPLDQTNSTDESVEIGDHKLSTPPLLQSLGKKKPGKDKPVIDNDGDQTVNKPDSPNASSNSSVIPNDKKTSGSNDKNSEVPITSDNKPQEKESFYQTPSSSSSSELPETVASSNETKNEKVNETQVIQDDKVNEPSAERQSSTSESTTSLNSSSESSTTKTAASPSLESLQSSDETTTTTSSDMTSTTTTTALGTEKKESREDEVKLSDSKNDTTTPHSKEQLENEAEKEAVVNSTSSLDNNAVNGTIVSRASEQEKPLTPSSQEEVPSLGLETPTTTPSTSKNDSSETEGVNDNDVQNIPSTEKPRKTENSDQNTHRISQATESLDDNSSSKENEKDEKDVSSSLPSVEETVVNQSKSDDDPTPDLTPHQTTDPFKSEGKKERKEEEDTKTQFTPADSDKTLQKDMVEEPKDNSSKKDGDDVEISFDQKSPPVEDIAFKDILDGLGDFAASLTDEIPNNPSGKGSTDNMSAQPQTKSETSVEKTLGEQTTKVPVLTEDIAEHYHPEVSNKLDTAGSSVNNGKLMLILF